MIVVPYLVLELPDDLRNFRQITTTSTIVGALLGIFQKSKLGSLAKFRKLNIAEEK